MLHQRLLKLAIALAVVHFLLCFNRAVCAQEQQQQQPTPKPTARKFDEFGDIYMTDIKARLDNFAIQLQQEPQARGFIIVYRSRRDLPGLSHRLAFRMRDYLVNIRGFPKAKIVTVDGGAASCLTQELWIVPPGATPIPKRDAYAHSYVDTESARKFDEFYFPMPQDYLEEVDFVNFGNSPDTLETFADALRNEPHTQAYIIAYAQYYKGRRDPQGTTQKLLRTERGYLTKQFGVAASRIKLVDGGYRKLREVEVWLVPRGVHAPIATPNTFPTRGGMGHKRAKGKV